MTTTFHGINCASILCAAALGANVQANETIQGRVLQAGNAQLSVRTADGRPQIFTVRAGAIITLNGMRTTLEDLRPGYPVTVTTSAGRLAIRVDAKSFGQNPGHDGDRARQPEKKCKPDATFSRSHCSRSRKWRRNG